MLEQADAVAGLRDDLTGFAELAAAASAGGRLAREHPGLRLRATGRVFHRLVRAVLEQKVTGKEAYRGYARLLRHFAPTPAPGPRPAAAAAARARRGRRHAVLGVPPVRRRAEARRHAVPGRRRAGRAGALRRRRRRDRAG